MSLTFAQMQQLLEEVGPSLAGAKCVAVKGVSAHTFVLSFQQAGSRQCAELLLCLHSSFLRFHLTTHPYSYIPPTPFLKALEKGVCGYTVVACALRNADRVLAVQFSNGCQVVVEFVPRRSNCYLIDAASHILAAWHPVQHTIYQLPERPKHPQEGQQVEAPINSRMVEAAYLAREKEAAFAQQKRTLTAQLQAQAVRADKHVQQRQAALEQCLQWPQWHHQGELLQSQLFRLHKGMTEVVVDDWNDEGRPAVIALDPLVEPSVQVGVLFKRSKKLRLGVPHTERLLQQAEQASAGTHAQLAGLDKVATPEELQAFCREHRLAVAGRGGAEAVRPPAGRSKEPAKPYHLYKLAGGLHAWVGKSAKDNDKLTFQCANGSDWWLHVRDYPGSHVVVRCPRGTALAGDALKDAAELALRFSQAKGIKQGEVALTQVKHLKRVKGVPGKVQLSKHKVVCHMLDEARWQRLKISKNVA